MNLEQYPWAVHAFSCTGEHFWVWGVLALDFGTQSEGEMEYPLPLGTVFQTELFVIVAGGWQLMTTGKVINVMANSIAELKPLTGLQTFGGLQR